jgi:DNA-binding NtrC family response regulator
MACALQPKPKMPPTESGALRVLIVDDEPLIRWSMAETLQGAGCSVTEAKDARDTLRQLSAAPYPDVILLDYRLPDSSNLQLLKSIRRISPNSAVVLMTAYGTPDLREGALNIGACRLIDKPVDMDDLAGIVEHAFESCRISGTPSNGAR